MHACARRRPAPSSAPCGGLLRPLLRSPQRRGESHSLGMRSSRKLRSSGAAMAALDPSCSAQGAVGRLGLVFLLLGRRARPSGQPGTQPPVLSNPTQTQVSHLRGAQSRCRVLSDEAPPRAPGRPGRRLQNAAPSDQWPCTPHSDTLKVAAVPLMAYRTTCSSVVGCTLRRGGARHAQQHQRRCRSSTARCMVIFPSVAEAP